jgi:hypothetical protein
MVDTTTKLVVAAESQGGLAPSTASMADILNGSTAVPGHFTGNFDGIVGAATPAAATFTFARGSAANGLTAAGTTRADALQLTAAINQLGTVAASTGVVLPASATVGVGGNVRIYNDGSNAAKVYALGSDTIDNAAGTTGVTLTNAKRCDFTVIASGAFESAQLGVKSA